MTEVTIEPGPRATARRAADGVMAGYIRRLARTGTALDPWDPRAHHRATNATEGLHGHSSRHRLTRYRAAHTRHLAAA